MSAARNRLGALAGLILLGMTSGACATNPATGGRMLSLVSESSEIRMGREGAEAVEASIGLYEDTALQAYVNSVGQRLAAASERPNLPWQFAVVEQPVVNAFALPGGFIYVARGIMTYFNSEAEMASVLGHEIGHVTARHTVQQISRAKLAGAGFLAGAIFAPGASYQYGGLLQQSLGLLFLSYSRGAESQSDMLGFRYMTRLGYDPQAAVAMFEILARERAAVGGARIPEWQSTHPDPGNRLAKANERVAEAGYPGGILGREEYLSHLDGVIFGENPRLGYFQRGLFRHPDLEFELRFPGGWQTQNTPRSVGALSPNRDAIIQLELDEATSASEAARVFFAQRGVSGSPSNQMINGLPASFGQFRVRSQGGTLEGYATFVEHGGHTYSIVAYTSSRRFRTYDDTFQETMASFRRLTDRVALAVEAQRIETVKIDRAMSLVEFNQAYPSTIPLRDLAVVNGLDLGTTIAGGTTLKRVVGRGAPN